MLVRTDLSAPQIAVQAIHAALEARHFVTHDGPHPHLVLCGVASEQRLLAAADYLCRRGIRCSLFREPDRENEATALATEPLGDSRRRAMRRFRCLVREDFLAAHAFEQTPGRPCRDRP